MTVTVDVLTKVFTNLRSQNPDVIEALTVFGEAFEAVFPDVDLTVKLGSAETPDEGQTTKAPWD